MPLHNSLIDCSNVLFRKVQKTAPFSSVSLLTSSAKFLYPCSAIQQIKEKIFLTQKFQALLTCRQKTYYGNQLILTKCVDVCSLESIGLYGKVKSGLDLETFRQFISFSQVMSITQVPHDSISISEVI